MYLVPAAGAPIALSTTVAFQVGTAVWVVSTSGICRLQPDGTTSGCFAIQTGWGIDDFHNPSPSIIPIGNDAAVLFGRPPSGNPKETLVYRVLPGQGPQYLGFGRVRRLPCQTEPLWQSAVDRQCRSRPPRSSPTPGDFEEALSDGRALLRWREQPGIDLNDDGDTSDEFTHLLAGGRSRGLDVLAPPASRSEMACSWQSTRRTREI